MVMNKQISSEETPIHVVSPTDNKSGWANNKGRICVMGIDKGRLQIA